MQNKILIAVTFLSLGLLIGLRQQHLQKDYMIKYLLGNAKQESVISAPKLPLIKDLK